MVNKKMKIIMWKRRKIFYAEIKRNDKPSKC